MNITAIIEAHQDNTYSVWAMNLSEEDKAAINRILEKYQDDGCSVRGTIDDLDLNEVL